jgi:O-antigen/teichoic acid export membrane protein
VSKSPILEDPQDDAAGERVQSVDGQGQKTPAADQPRSSVRSDAVYVVVCRVVGIAATMAGHMLASRWLGPTEYGQFVLLTTVIALGSIFAMKGLNEAGLRFLAESLARGGPQLAQSFLLRIGWTLLVNSMVATIVFAAAMLLFHTFIRSFNDPFWLIALTSGGMMLLAWQQVSAESLRGYGELGRASLYSGGQTGGPVSNLLFLALFGLSALYFSQIGLTWAVLIAVASILLTLPFALGGLWKVSHKYLGQQREPESVPGDPADSKVSDEQNQLMNRVGTVLMFNQVLAFGVAQLDIWIGAAILEGADLGFYGAAKRALMLVALPLQMAMMVALPVVPRLRAQNRTKDLEKFLRSTASYAAVPSLLAAAALLMFPGQILAIVFGSEYAAAATILVVMILGQIVGIVVGNPPYILAMAGQQSTVFSVNLAAAAVMAIFGTIGALKFGATGLAIGAAASLIVQQATLWWVARRRLGIWTHLGRPILPWHESRNHDSSGFNNEEPQDI